MRNRKKNRQEDSFQDISPLLCWTGVIIIVLGFASYCVQQIFFAGVS